MSLNTGAAFGYSPHIVFGDVDCLPARDLVERAAKLADNDGVATCRIHAIPEDSLDDVNELWDRWDSFAQHAVARHPLAKGGFILVPRRAHERIGGHDEAFNGMGAMDVDYYARLKWLGLEARELPGPVYHVNHSRNLGIMEEIGPDAVKAAKKRNQQRYNKKCYRRGPVVANGGAPTNAARLPTRAAPARRKP